MMWKQNILILHNIKKNKNNERNLNNAYKTVKITTETK